MKTLFTVLLLGLITNEALGRYNDGPNNIYYPQPIPPIPQPLPPTLEPISSIPEPVPLIPEPLPPIIQPLPPLSNLNSYPPVPDYQQPLPLIPYYPQPNGLPIYGKSLEPSKYQIRYKRQANEENLEDRYDFDRQRQNWIQPGTGNEPFPRPRPRPNRPGGRPFPRPNGDQGPPSGRPNQGPAQPNQGSTQPTQGPAQPNQNPTNGNTTQDPSAACVSSCPVTSEYNPVCGSNGVTYPNPGRLLCAQMCGVGVNLSRQSPCPTTTTTAPPQN